MSSRHAARLRPWSLLVLAALLPSPARASGENGLTDRVSFAANGSQVTLNCAEPDVTPDGRYVAYSTVEALLPEDVNGLRDVYVYDRQSGNLICASVSTFGFYGNGDASAPSLSADGQWVAFQSSASNLIGFDNNGASDVFLKDLQSGFLHRLSGAGGGIVAASGASHDPSVSDDGRYVAFHSSAPDLVPGDTNGEQDVFVYDLQLSTVTLASFDLWGGPTNGASYSASISGDGQRVAFVSEATDMALFDDNGVADVYLYTQGSPVIGFLSQSWAGAANGSSYRPSISGDGQRVVFESQASDLVPGDDNGVSDVFLWQAFQMQLVSAGMGGEVGDAFSGHPDISPDGRYAVFRSYASNLVPVSAIYGEVFVRDLDVGRTWLVSRPTGVTELANGLSRRPAVAEAAALVVFESDATNLDPADTNGVRDIYARTVFHDPEPYCDSTPTADGCLPSTGSVGVPSATAASGFEVRAIDVPVGRTGMLFYGLAGRQHTPFLGATLCVVPPKRRTPLIDSGPGWAADPCSGVLSLDMNAFAAGALGGNPDPALSVVGQKVNVQFWGRDPGSAPFHVFLSDALEYIVGP